MYFNFTAYNQLVSYGVHIGHSWKNSLLFSSWMVYSFRKNILIINLFKFMSMLKISFALYKKNLYNYAPIWFINLDNSVSQVIQYSALRCGEFFINNKWIRGLVSNYFSVFNSYRRLKYLSSLIKNRKEKRMEKNFKYWVLTRMTWPRALFISCVHSSYLACKEAFSLKIPSIGIVDTNTFSQSVHIAIPGNDESTDCLVFYNETVSNYILYYKFKLILFWFLNVRRVKRLVSFNDWLFSKSVFKKFEKFNFYNFSFYNIFSKSLEIFYSLNGLKEFHLFKFISTNLYQINLDKYFFNLRLLRKKYLSMMYIFFLQARVKKGLPYKNFLKRSIFNKNVNRITRKSLFTFQGLLRLKKLKYFNNKLIKYKKSNFIKYFLYIFFLYRYSKYASFYRFIIRNWKIKKQNRKGFFNLKKIFLTLSFFSNLKLNLKKSFNFNFLKLLKKIKKVKKLKSKKIKKQNKIKIIRYKKNKMCKRFLLSGNLVFDKLLPRKYWNFYKKNVMINLAGNNLKQKRNLSKYYLFAIKFQKRSWKPVVILNNKKWCYEY
jgi:small subunit ribosomal protein S2